MEWIKNLSEDQKNNIFVAVFLTAVLLFVCWAKGCFETQKYVQPTVVTVPTTYRVESTEMKLFNFLNDSKAVVDNDKGTWFDFDKVNFESGTSQLTPSSEEQLKNISAVINQFPQATFKIGGYTDNTGSETNNLKLSEERAMAISKKLIDLGAKSEQIVGAEGYGSKYPIADNNTAEGREKNRRISIRVKSK